MMNSRNLLLIGVAMLFTWHLGAMAQQPAAVDISKSGIERPAKAVLAESAAPADISKGGIEIPAKAVLAGSTSPEFHNPKVAPGKIKWHADFAAACAAAKKSGKPVLLFHLMGKLDDQFC